MRTAIVLTVSLLVAACTDGNPPAGQYGHLAAVASGGCRNAFPFQSLEVDGARLTWTFGLARVKEDGEIGGDCIDIPETDLGAWRAYSLCRADGDAATAHQESGDGSCTYDITATR